MAFDSSTKSRLLINWWRWASHGTPGFEARCFEWRELDLIQTCLTSDEALASFVSLLLCCNGGPQTNSDDNIAISTSHVYDSKFTVEQLEDWENSGLIVVFPDRVELLAPCFYADLRKHLFQNKAALCLDGFRVTVRGWRGYGSAGGAAEPIILQDMGKKAVEKVTESHISLYDVEEQPKIKREGGVCFLVTSSNEPEALSPSFIPSLVNRIMAVKKDTGLDAFVLCPPTNDNKAYSLHGLQIKLGTKGHTLSRGVLTTQLMCKENNKKIDDSCIAGIAMT